jgi:hypothetical protein
MAEPPTTFLERHENPFFGGFQASNIVEARIVKVHTDEANNVTMTADVVTIKGEQKYRVPFLFPHVNADGTAGIFAVPNVGDRCLIVLAAGNLPYIAGYHSAAELEEGRASAVLASSTGNGRDGEALKGGFARTQLIPGAIELRSPMGNRLLVHPGGSIAIDAKSDLFTFYDAVLTSVTTLTRGYRLLSAGGSVLWDEGREKTKRSMSLAATFFTKSATKENLDAGELRDGARMQILFSEDANHFFLEIKDKDDITSRIAIGPNGIILTSGDGTNSGSITLAPSGNFSLAAGDPAGIHTQLDLSPTAIAISAFTSAGPPVATVLAETNGNVTVSSNVKVLLDAPIVQSTKLTQLALGGLGVARLNDRVAVTGVEGGGDTRIGKIITSSGRVQAAT